MPGIFFLFPHPFPATLLLMYRERELIQDAHVRTMPVVKADVSAGDAAHPVHVAEQSLTVDTLCLNDAVDPFRHGIVRRLMVFRHADGDVMLPKHLHIGVTAVLYAMVRMVDQSLQACAAPHRHGLTDGLLQRRQGDGRTKGIGQDPSDYLM